MTLADAPSEGQARAWRIEFANEARPGTEELLAFRQPRPSWAYTRPLEVETALTSVAGPSAPDPAVTFVFLPAGAATPFETQKKAESWMASRGDEHGAPIEILYRSERLLWRAGRAVLFGTSSSCAEMISAVARFSRCEAILRELEQASEASWNTLEADIPLTHSVTARDLKHQSHVDEMTRAAAGRRIAFTRLQMAIESPGPELAGPARRIFAELAVQASTVERLKAVDDTIEIAEDLYELANDRLSEFRYFLREYRIEVLIVVVLLAELLVTSYDIFY